jgi:hypothetical protein
VVLIIRAFVSGCRYHEVIEADHITFIIDRDRAGVKFDILYDSIFERCRKYTLRTDSTLSKRGLETHWTSSSLSESGLEQSRG